MTKLSPTSTIRLALTAALLVGATLSSSGCAGKRWESAERIAYPSDGKSQSARFDAALARVRDAGYVTDEVDAERGFLCVRARHGDGGVVLHSTAWPTPAGAAAYGVAHGTSTQSWLILQVNDDGDMEVSAQGHAVREEKGTIHRKLRAEMDAFAALVSGAERRPLSPTASVTARR